MKRGQNHEGPPAKRQKTAEHDKVPPSSETVQSARSLVQQNDLDGLQSLLASCSPQERRGVFQNAQLQSSLHVAFSHGNQALLTFLLEECGVDVDHREEEQGVTVLHLAVQAGDVVTTKLLLDHGAQVNFPDDDSGTQGCSHNSLLRVVLSTGNPQIFRMLLRAGFAMKMWSKPKTKWPVCFGSDHFDDMVHCAMDFGLYRRENQELLGHFLEAAVREGSETFDVLWPHRPPGTDHFRLALLGLSHPHGREKTFLTLLWEESLSFSERVDLMECYGAWLIVFKGEFFKGLYLWEDAMKLRWENFDPPLMKKSVPYSLGKLLGVAEVRNPQEMQDLNRSPLHLSLHATCVYERVFVDAALEVHAQGALQWLRAGCREYALSLLSHVVQRGKCCEDPCTFANCAFEAYCKILTSGQNFPAGLNVFRLVLPLLDLLLHCQEKCFRCIVEHSGRSRHDVVVPGKFSCLDCRLLRSLEAIFCKTTWLLWSVRSTAAEVDLRELRKLVVTFIRLDPRLGRLTRLHVACSECHGSSEVIQLLVECSAEVGPPTQETNSAAHLFADHLGRSPLHILAEKMTPTQLLDEGTVGCFVKHGAQLSAKDKSGRSVLDILRSRGIDIPTASLSLCSAWEPGRCADSRTRAP